MNYKCECGKLKEVERAKTYIKNGELLSDVFCECGNRMKFIKQNTELPSKGIYKGSSNPSIGGRF